MRPEAGAGDCGIGTIDADEIGDHTGLEPKAPEDVRQERRGYDVVVCLGDGLARHTGPRKMIGRLTAVVIQDERPLQGSGDEHGWQRGEEERPGRGREDVNDIRPGELPNKQRHVGGLGRHGRRYLTEVAALKNAGGVGLIGTSQACTSASELHSRRSERAGTEWPPRMSSEGATMATSSFRTHGRCIGAPISNASLPSVRGNSKETAVSRGHFRSVLW